MVQIRLKSGFTSLDFPPNRKINLKEKEIFLYKGTPHQNNCYLILQGQLEVRLIAGNGHETLLYHLNPGDLVGELAMFGFKNRTATIIASENTEVLQISHDEFNKRIKDYDFLQQLTALFLQRYMHAHEVICRLTQPNISMKLCRYLKTLADQHDSNKNIIQLRLPSHAELSRLLSCQRETITREIKKLVNAQVITAQDAHLIQVDRKRIEFFLSDMG